MTIITKTSSSCRNISDVPPSNKIQSADHLIDVKKIKIRGEVQLQPPTDLGDVLQRLVEKLGVLPVSRGGLNHLQPVTKVLTEEHSNEDIFGKGLYKALREFLVSEGLVQACETINDPSELTGAVSSAAASSERATGSPRKRSRRSLARLLGVISPSMKKREERKNEAKMLEAGAQKLETDNIPTLARNEEQDRALEPIVFNCGLDETAYPMYAIDIARQANGDHRPANSPGQRSSNTSEHRSTDSTSGVAANSRLDHCSCLLEKTEPGGKWKVLRIFSVVELKALSDGQCAYVSVDENNLQSVDISSGSGVVLQSLRNTMAWSLPSHAEVKQLDDLEWAAIIGKRKPRETGGTKVAAITERDATAPTKGVWKGPEDNRIKKIKAMPPPNKYRWVTGKIYVPEKCGDPFAYSATSCGNLDTLDAVSGAVSVYLETLLFGVCAAKQLLELIKSKKMIAAFPTSGKNVMFGNVTIPNLTLRGKPTNDIPTDTTWMVSQGEIFTGKINFHQLNTELQKSADADLFTFTDDNKPVDVALKVSSICVHRYLNHPSDAWNAMTIINAAYVTSKQRKKKKPGECEDEESSEVETYGEESDKEKKSDKNGDKWDLFHVLLAVERLTNGLITIMADLSPDYKVLTPQDDALSFNFLWHAFLNLLLRILVPLADLKIIHPDIRPGWDVTSNILCLKDSRTHCDKPTMQIIDFESLVLNSVWLPPEPRATGPKFKYIPRVSGWSCYTFLWWQSATMAFAWHERVTQANMEIVNLKAILSNDSHPFSRLLGRGFCSLVRNEKISKEEFMDSVDDLTATFCGQTK